MQQQNIELRMGDPYANLVRHQQLFTQALGRYFAIDPAYIIPTAGATGAIESVRTHVLKLSKRETPIAYMLSPEYWRARESFQGLGFTILDLRTQQQNFFIDEQKIVKEVEAASPDLLYLSLPNNPTGATFLPEEIIKHISERTVVIIDFTLPCAELNPQAVLPELHRHFAGRSNLFLVGSLSKSHGTAEQRTGWLICCNLEDAGELRNENRNVISVVAIQEALKCLDQKAPALEKLARSFAILRDGERSGVYEIVQPPRAVESGYVLIKAAGDIRMLQAVLESAGISVMWGAELDLPEGYIRLEMLEASNIAIFVRTVQAASLKLSKK